MIGGHLIYEVASFLFIEAGDSFRAFLQRAQFSYRQHLRTHCQNHKPRIGMIYHTVSRDIKNTCRQSSHVEVFAGY